MEPEAPDTPPARRPRTWLLALLGLVVVAAIVAINRGGSADPASGTSNPSRPQQRQTGEKLDPDALEVKLEKLKGPLPVPDATDRNPFRFKPKPPPPPPPAPKEAEKPVFVGPIQPPPPPPPPGPPPIPLKFIGVTEAPRVGKIAALTDCRQTVQGVEGEVIWGQYRIVKIGIESLVIEYVDGKGRTTLRMSGQECVVK